MNYLIAQDLLLYNSWNLFFRQGNINDGREGLQNPSEKHFNPYTEFKEFSRKQIKDFRKKFDL